MVPFVFGTNTYAEKIDATATALGTAQTEVVRNINPGGFMRGVRVIVSSTGGALGGGTLNPDAPECLFASLSIENVDGAPIMFPMPGFSYGQKQKWARPWLGDAHRRPGFVNGPNPAFSMFIQPEIKWTAGVLANTDSRAQFRFRYTLATLATLISGGAPTGPTVTVTLYLETWAQPEDKDLEGRAIQTIPPGMGLSTITRRQILNYTAAGADNTFQLSNTGNEIRCMILISRDSSNVRQNLMSDPVRLRIDNRSLGVMSPDEIVQRMADFYPDLQAGGLRDTGVLVLPRFRDVGRLMGEGWLSTINATYFIIETATATGGTSGTLEVITDEVVPTAAGVPFELESI